MDNLSKYLSIDDNGILVVPIVNFSILDNKIRDKHYTGRFSEVLGFTNKISPVSMSPTICTINKRKKY